ncbi:twin-arginine translocation signal domain-containing protein [Vibrio cholerae]|uniref:twin-arginine translocation signal domain-containing protein n=1 Tax=Vibrio cholerae TaxID=666 RepID=UPI001A9D01AC|nr:twin-arginine translocation signal domain-containing protein [Vibrio cholerae]MBO1366724.1 transcriptional initiation protein Tat [Vibrio cholerae]MBO1370286.1 transcriptional initiation protein Tat [Vibrio cholerae]MBO1373802.1 transcriptional initiation protein Tat [Vibrio cholerae]MBO1377690.1 transcriptional initiation protein Tat [Vibrio cholerae]MBO1407238.1 transcriptional initiation protein Tat [Vibrio cholerae]
MKKENQVNQSRRDLLKGLGTAAVAGAVVAGVSTQTVASEANTENKEPLKKGYHETQHIRDYYNTL